MAKKISSQIISHEFIGLRQSRRFPVAKQSIIVRLRLSTELMMLAWFRVTIWKRDLASFNVPEVRRFGHAESQNVVSCIRHNCYTSLIHWFTKCLIFNHFLAIKTSNTCLNQNGIMNKVEAISLVFFFATSEISLVVVRTRMLLNFATGKNGIFAWLSYFTVIRMIMTSKLWIVNSVMYQEFNYWRTNLRISQFSSHWSAV